MKKRFLFLGLGLLLLTGIAFAEDKEPRVIKLEAFQYGFSPDPVEVKTGERIKLEITSRDVKHGVYIKEYGINETVNKGETKEVEFTADKAGTFDIICSVYCGSGHSGMKAKLIVSNQ